MSEVVTVFVNGYSVVVDSKFAPEAPKDARATSWLFVKFSDGITFRHDIPSESEGLKRI